MYQYLIPTIFRCTCLTQRISHTLADPQHQFSLSNVPDLNGKVAIVTGGSEGIGYGCTHTLLSHNISRIFILSLSQSVVDGALDSIQKEMGHSIARRVTWLKCDLSDWPAVAKIAKRIASETDRVDILVNNAARGIMTAQLTEYGVDRHMAVNHMGHVILTSHLMPLMKETAKGGSTVRVVCLGSNAHQGTPSDTKFDSLEELNRDLGPNAQYGRSKLAQMLYARYLSTHLTPSYPNILVNSVHPGFVDTKSSRVDIHEAYPLGGYAMSVGMAPFKKDQFEGCVSAMFAATKTENTGQYICPPAIPEEGSELYKDTNLGEKLMELTKEILKEKTREVSVDRGCPFELA
jgi:NAD(P)-dependent dehydrogenase (short-subunit alcohol dehydrogenase family)